MMIVCLLFIHLPWIQVKEFYRSCVNIQEIDRLGAEPMMEVIDSCGGWDLAGAPPGGAGWESGSIQTRPDFNEMLYRTQGLYSTGVFFSLTVNVDDKNSSRNAIRVSAYVCAYVCMYVCACICVCMCACVR